MKGFTLIEIITVIVLVGITIIGLSSFMTQLLDTYRFIDIRNDIAYQAKKTLDWMASDIKKIKDEFSISVADSDRLTFTDSDDNTIEFALVGDVINRNGYPLCEDVETLEFTYFNERNQVLGPLPLNSAKRRQIRKIRINLTLERAGQQIDFFTVVCPRNLYE